MRTSMVRSTLDSASSPRRCRRLLMKWPTVAGLFHICRRSDQMKIAVAVSAARTGRVSAGNIVDRSRRRPGWMGGVGRRVYHRGNSHRAGRHGTSGKPIRIDQSRGRRLGSLRACQCRRRLIRH